jgi:phage FluMu protein Com
MKVLKSGKWGWEKEYTYTNCNAQLLVNAYDLYHWKLKNSIVYKCPECKKMNEALDSPFLSHELPYLGNH